MQAAVNERLEEIRRAAETAVEKPAGLGPDIDLARFDARAEHATVASMQSLERQVREAALAVGVDASEAGRAGSYMQIDRSTVYEAVQDAYRGQIEIMSTTEAIERFPEVVERYWWRAVAPDKDKYTSRAALHQTEGYFIRVKAGEHVDRPIQSCLLVSENRFSQNVHNVIAVEDGASANVITGCTIHPEVEEGIHIGVSEFYVGRGASLTFTMIHNWAESFQVRPRTGIVVEEGGTFVNNYVLLREVRSIQSYPSARLAGENARAVFNTIVYGLGDSVIDLGAEVILEAPGCRAESVARSVARDRSAVWSRGRLVGRHDDVKAHLDCRGIVFGHDASMYAIPELAAEGAPRAELSHEAAISPIAEEEVTYLMSRGLPKDEAVSMITRGFVNLEIPGLPAPLRASIDRAIAETTAESM